jgi:microcystin-dependent protein
MPLLLPPAKFRELNNLGTAPLAGGQVETYAAGTSSPIGTFADPNGATANPWPVVLDSQGRADIWIPEDTAVKVVLKDSGSATVYTVDGVTGVGSGSGAATPATASEWVLREETPTYLSATTFTVSGDLRSTYQVGRRVRAQVSAGLTYHTITAADFLTGATTVTITNDSTPLDAGLSSVSVGLLSTTNPSATVDAIVGIDTISSVLTGTITAYGGPAAPAGYVLCDGALYDGTDPTYTALWNVIGTTYEGSTGQTSFAVPDARNRTLIGFGLLDGTGGSVSIGVKQGSEEMGITLTQANLPAISVRDPGAAYAVSVPGTPTRSVADAINTTLGSAEAIVRNLRSPQLAVGVIIKL